MCGACQQMTQRSVTDEEVWLQAALAYISAANSTSKWAMESWADHALEQFKVRFRV